MSGLPYQSMDELVAQSIAALEAADRDAAASRVAFLAGRFDEYWQQRVAEAEAAIEAMYEQYVAVGKDSGEGSGPGTGPGGGGEGGGIGGPSPDVEGSRPEGDGQPPNAGQGAGDG